MSSCLQMQYSCVVFAQIHYLYICWIWACCLQALFADKNKENELFSRYMPQNTLICMHRTRLHAHAYTHTHAHVHTYTRTHVHTHARTHTHIHTCPHTYPRTHVTDVFVWHYLFLCVCVWVYFRTFKSLESFEYYTTLRITYTHAATQHTFTWPTVADSAQVRYTPAWIHHTMLQLVYTHAAIHHIIYIAYCCRLCAS